MVLLLQLLTVLNPSLCEAEHPSLWTKASWQFFDWLGSTQLLLPGILITILLPLMVKRIPYRRWASGIGMALLAFYCGLSFPALSSVGNRLLLKALPQDTGNPVDAIVVLGRSESFRPQRVDVAAELWHKGEAPFIFLSGRGDALEMASMLKEQGIPPEAIQGEPCSRTTEENAQVTAHLLQPRVHHVILITDAPHMVRSYLTFSSLGFDVVAHPSPMPPLGRRQQGLLIAREYIGLISYALLGRYFPRDLPDTQLVESA